MAKKKRHHYIPRFYLKRFSINNDGKFLGLYNLDNRKFIQEAALKNQAYVNFLYGEDDEIENALADMEGGISRMFYYWTEEKLLYPPPSETNGSKLLKRFILFQAFRTPKAGSELMEKLNESLKTFVRAFKPDLSKSLEDGTLVHKAPVLLGLLESIKHERCLDFLDCKFLVNLSLLPFVTSDAPVVFYNQLMEQANNYMGATGLVAKGFQVFYPIHPRLMICLYDPEAYDFGNGSINCSSTESIDEIHQLNGLQLANCRSQVFFDDSISEQYIKELCSHYEKYRGTSKKVNEFINQGNRKFFLMSSEDIRVDLRLSFFRLKVDPKDFTNVVVQLRHPSLEHPPVLNSNN